MSLPVRFTDEATAKLRAIHAYLMREAPALADAVIDRITRRAERIGEWPQGGPVVPKYRLSGVREVLERPYRILYRIRPDAIEVITVMHYRQLLPEDLAGLHGG